MSLPETNPSELPERQGPLLSVVIPVYNEGQRIRGNLVHVSEYLASHFPSYEIIVVDDGSTDASVAVASEFASQRSEIEIVRHPVNRGKGAALRTGLSRARGQWLASLDADLELPVELLEGFLGACSRSGKDVVVGSKRVPGGEIDYPISRRILSASFHLLVRWLFDLHVKDTQVGIKLFSRRSVNGNLDPIRSEKYLFDLELLIALERQGFKILEAPVTLSYDRRRLGRLNIKAVLGMAGELAGLWFRTYISRSDHANRGRDSASSSK